MDRKIFLIVFAVFVQVSFQEGHEGTDFYRASVVDFSRHRKQEDNLNEYEFFVKNVKLQDADIIVFPENTLHGTSRIHEDKLLVVPQPEDRATPCNNTEHGPNEMMNRLSCLAQKYGIYVVVNVLERVSCNSDDPDCPGQGRYIYNTDVVFDRKGTLIARYRKFNVYQSAFVQKPKEPEYAYFDTDFGVRFGIFTSIDILFQTPAIDLVQQYNITNFVNPSYWYGELPFLTGTATGDAVTFTSATSVSGNRTEHGLQESTGGYEISVKYPGQDLYTIRTIQLQSGWSCSMNVNLLSAGASKSETGTGGSGIYIGNKGTAIYSMPDEDISLAMISLVPKNPRTMTSDMGVIHKSVISFEDSNPSRPAGRKNATNNHMQFKWDETITEFESMTLNENEEEFDEEICSGETLCCHFRISYKKAMEAAILTPNSSYRYRAVAYQGNKKLSNEITGKVEICAVILCTGEDLSDCGKRPALVPEYRISFRKISIETNVRSEQTVHMPNVLLSNCCSKSYTRLSLPSKKTYDFDVEDKEDGRRVKMNLKSKVNDLITFGIFGRDFSSGSAALHHTSFHVLVLVVALVFICFS